MTTKIGHRGEKEGKRKTKEELAGDHPQRPERLKCDVEGCSQCGGRRGWMEEMCCLL